MEEKRYEFVLHLFVSENGGRNDRIHTPSFPHVAKMSATVLKPQIMRLRVVFVQSTLHLFKALDSNVYPP